MAEGEELASNILSQICAATLCCDLKRFYAAATLVIVDYSRRTDRLPMIGESSNREEGPASGPAGSIL